MRRLMPRRARIRRRRSPRPCRNPASSAADWGGASAGIVIAQSVSPGALHDAMGLASVRLLPRKDPDRMPHLRVLPTATAAFMPDGALPSEVAGAVRTGGRVYLGAVSGEGDATAQTNQAMDAIESALAAAGAAPSDLAQLRVALVDRAHQAD